MLDGGLCSIRGRSLGAWVLMGTCKVLNHCGDVVTVIRDSIWSLEDKLERATEARSSVRVEYLATFRCEGCGTKTKTVTATATKPRVPHGWVGSLDAENGKVVNRYVCPMCRPDWKW